jgi:hypothetical protein
MSSAAALGKSSYSQVCFSAPIQAAIPARVQFERRLLAYSFGVLASRHKYQLATKNSCAVLGYYLAGSGNFLPTFRDKISVSSSGLRNPTAVCEDLVSSVFWNNLSVPRMGRLS